MVTCTRPAGSSIFSSRFRVPSGFKVPWTTIGPVFMWFTFIDPDSSVQPTAILRFVLRPAPCSHEDGSDPAREQRLFPGSGKARRLHTFSRVTTARRKPHETGDDLAAVPRHGDGVVGGQRSAAGSGPGVLHVAVAGALAGRGDRDCRADLWAGGGGGTDRCRDSGPCRPARRRGDPDAPRQ